MRVTELRLNGNEDERHYDAVLSKYMHTHTHTHTHAAFHIYSYTYTDIYELNGLVKARAARGPQHPVGDVA